MTRSPSRRCLTQIRRRSEAAIDLGDLSRGTRGLLPRAVYADAAAKDCLLAARHLPTGRVVGYVLFRLPRDEVVLTHVCVDEPFRRAGIAKLLVDEVSRRHDQHQGIRATCRDDYDIEATWRALDFTKQAAGRARQGCCRHDSVVARPWSSEAVHAPARRACCCHRSDRHEYLARPPCQTRARQRCSQAMGAPGHRDLTEWTARWRTSGSSGDR